MEAFNLEANGTGQVFPDAIRTYNTDQSFAKLAQMANERQASKRERLQPQPGCPYYDKD